MVVVQTEARTALPSVSEALKFIEEATGHDLAVDTETTGLNIRDGRDYTQGVSIGYRPEPGQPIRAYYFPFRHKYGSNYPSSVLFALRDLVEAAPTCTFHHAKFDLVALEQLGIRVRTGGWICTLMMAHLVNENWPMSKDLDNCAREYLDGRTLKAMSQEMANIVNDKNLGWAYVPSEMMFDYAAQDTVVTYELREALWSKFKAEGLDQYWPHKARLIEVVIEMERRGVLIDQEFIRKQIDASEQAIQDYSELLGGYSPTSPKDLKALLIDKLELPVVKRTPKGAPSFDKEAMKVYEEILEHHTEPLAEYVLGGRGWTHARGLFYNSYLENVSPDGRLRPKYMHHKDSDDGGTVTGRLSCKEPNLQQIPRVTNKAWNGRVKKCFRGSPGYSLWEADYAQLELRLGTAYAKEPSLIRLFEEGRDVFAEMAQTLGWPRQETKGFVYSTQYGAGKVRISHVFGVSEDAAQGLINQYYRTYPKFKLVSEEAKQRVLSMRKLRLWSGRYRHFARPRDENHKAFNSLIQGGAADIVERVMVYLFDNVDQKSDGEVRMLLQVHDSVIFEIKDGTEEKWGPIIVDAMSKVNEICVDFGVKFAVDFHKFGGD